MAQVTPRPFSPPRSTPSPSALSPGSTFPNKRPRLSPKPSAPLALNTIAPPNYLQPIPLPGAGILTNGTAAMPQPTTGTMGPPSKPVEKPTDTAELTDVIAQSGIDIRDEEKYLTASLSQKQNQNAYMNNAASVSVATAPRTEANPYLASNGYNELRYHAQYGQPAFPGPMQQAAPPISAEEIAREKWGAAVRRRAEARAIHLQDPFLQPEPTKARLKGRVYEVGVLLPSLGPPDSQHPPQPGYRETNVVGTDGASIKSVKGAYHQKNSTLDEILTLISLAAGERIRGLVEDAAALAKRRRVGSHGEVPLEWADLAVGNGLEPAPSAAAAASKSGLDSAVSPKTNPLKRSFSTANDLPKIVSSNSAVTAKKITFPNELARKLRALATKERDREEARLSKRARRSSKAGNGTEGSTASPGSAGGLLGERAPEVEPKKLTKKEQARQNSARMDEVHQHKSANSTANMMLKGKSRFGGKSYAWMNTENTTTVPGPAARPGSAGTPGASSDGGASATKGYTVAGGKRLGEWREDRDKGEGIQLRDWASVLELESKEKASIARVLARLK